MKQLDKILKELPGYFSPFNLSIIKHIDNTYEARYIRINSEDEIYFSDYKGEGKTQLQALRDLKKFIEKYHNKTLKELTKQFITE